MLDVDYSKFVTTNGQYLTQGLFYEFRYQTKLDYIPYTLKEYDFDGYISMYRVYMEADTEYEAAKILLNSWKHWEILAESPMIGGYIQKWREERDIKDAALAKAVLIKETKAGNTSAAKAVLEASTKRKAGRPTKIEVESEKRKQAKIDSKVSSILDRMSKH